MKKPPLAKKPLIAIIAILSFAAFKPSFAWSGYDYDNKTEIEIESGNLVREGLTFQFYEMKSDSYHTAKVLFIDYTASNTKIQLQDLDEKKERTFIMQN